MEGNSKRITQLVTKEQMKSVSNLFCIVQVSFPDEDLEPIYLASDEKLTNGDVIEYVKRNGLSTDRYRITHWIRKDFKQI